MKSKIWKVGLPAALIATALWSGGTVLGAWLGRVFPGFDAWPLYIILVVAFVLLCIGNRMAAHLFQRAHFGMPLEERRPFIEENRAAARRDPKGMLAEQGSLLLMPLLTVSMYYLLVAGMTVAGQMCHAPTAFLGIWLFYMPLSLTLSARPARMDRSVLVLEEELPALHALARRAAEAAGVRGGLRLEIPASAEVEVNRFGRTYVVILGTMALAVSTEEELYAELVGSFLPYATPKEIRREQREERAAAMGSATVRPGSCLFDLFYANASVRLEWGRMLAHYPRLYRQYGDMAARLRALGLEQAFLDRYVKANMWRLFNFEYARHDPILLYETPKPPVDYETRLAVHYRRAMCERRAEWCRLLAGELHTDLSAALLVRELAEILGLGDRPLLSEVTFPAEGSDYGHACAAAIALGDRRVTRDLAASYESARRHEYSEPVEVIATWEASDRQWPTPELSPVINAYRDLFRLDEAEALCDRILAEEPNLFAQAHALYVKGQILLHRYDADGIDFIYRSMDINKNYMENGLSSVEAFCALCGLSDELEAHHRRSVTLREAHSYNQYGAGTLTASDRLVREEELGDQLTDILGYMESVGGGYLERVYLVRKIVSEDFFTSAFVLYFAPGAGEEAIRRAYEAIFNYLDAYPVDWQFSLFFYNRETEAAVRRVEGALVWEKKG